MLMRFDRTELMKLFDTLTRDPEEPRSFLYSLAKEELRFDFLIWSHERFVFFDLYNKHTSKQLLDLGLDFIQKIVCKEKTLFFYRGLDAPEIFFTLDFDKNQLLFRNSAFNKLPLLEPIKDYDASKLSELFDLSKFKDNEKICDNFYAFYDNNWEFKFSVDSIKNEASLIFKNKASSNSMVHFHFCNIVAMERDENVIRFFQQGFELLSVEIEIKPSLTIDIFFELEIP